MQQNAAGIMTLRRAFKGSLFTELECKGGDWGGTADGRHLWAGNSAVLDAPMMRLVKALATLYDEDQHATVDGVEELLQRPVEADSPEVQAIVAATRANPQWEEAMRHNLNVRRLMHGRPMADHLVHSMLGTTINIQGITGGYVGPSFYTMLPGQASAKVDFRFPPGVTPEQFAALLQAHLDRRGFDSVRVSKARGYAGAAAVPLAQDTLLAAAHRTATRHGVPITEWPISNNCCPAALLTGLRSGGLADQVPFSIAGTGCGDRAHAPDEFITVGSVRSLMHWTADFLGDWAQIVAPSRGNSTAGIDTDGSGPLL
jgi:acetylornithine deacetylase/succinyl-diaminopimelate desuccinylase-like protein